MPVSDLYGFDIELTDLPNELERIKQMRLDEYPNLDLDDYNDRVKLARYSAVIRELEERIGR